MAEGGGGGRFSNMRQIMSKGKQGIQKVRGANHNERKKRETRC